MSLTVHLIYLLIIFSMFPYIEILPLGTDSQPNALLIALILFPFCCKWKMNRDLACLSLLALMGFLALFISPANFNSIRSTMNYFTLFFVSYVTFFALQRIGGIPYKLFKWIIYTWFFIGTIQLLIYPDFMSFLTPRGDSALTMKSGRGIVCLAPEPTFYGLTCLIFGVIAYLNFKNKPDIKKIYTLIAVQLFLYSRSSLVIFLLMATGGLYILLVVFSKKKYFLKVLTFGSILLLLSLGLIHHYSEVISSNRFGMLLLILLENPESFLILDASVNERFIHVFFPLYGFLKDMGLPHGYGMFPDFMANCMNAEQFQHLISDYVLERESPTRIMSGLGSLFYELGFFGFLLIGALADSVCQLVTGKQRIILLFILMAILLNAIPFSNPLIPFLIGNMIYLGYEKRKTNSLSY